MSEFFNLFGNRGPDAHYVCQIPFREGVERWSQNIDPVYMEAHWCGMCCVRSILLTFGESVPHLADLFKLACMSGVYRPLPVGWQGAHHNELALFVKRLTGHAAHTERGMLPERILYWLNEMNFCILSVHPDIRCIEAPIPDTKRGHLVLVYGYQYDEAGMLHFLINNSAGFAGNNSQVGVSVPASRLVAFSCGDGILVPSYRTYDVQELIERHC